MSDEVKVRNRPYRIVGSASSNFHAGRGVISRRVDIAHASFPCNRCGTTVEHYAEVDPITSATWQRIKCPGCEVTYTIGYARKEPPKP